MSPRSEDLKKELLDKLVELINEKLSAQEAPLAARFAVRYYRDIAPSDLLERELADLYGAAVAHFRYAQNRPAGKTSIRVYNPQLQQHGWQSTHTVVEIVIDDMPFLVDSVGMELARNGLGTHLVIHPVVRVVRDDKGDMTDVESASADDSARDTLESIMHFEIDRQSDADLIASVEADLHRVCSDVRKAVTDWPEMQARVKDAKKELEPASKVIPSEDLEELVAFLDWLADNHFTFLGYSRYDLETIGDDLALRRIKGSGLGILRGHDDGGHSKSFNAMPHRARLRAIEAAPAFSLAKANTKSTVHRATYLDFVGIKRYAEDGTVIGENRFLGLFTSAAYNRSPKYIPLLRRKIEKITDRSGFSHSGHAGKALVNILETYPRDELVQTDEDQLLDITLQILYLQERQRTRLFMRKDAYERFVAFIVYIPRERYNTAIRQRVEKILLEAAEGSEIEFKVELSESLLARIHFTVRTPNQIPAGLNADEIEARLQEATVSWSDRLQHAIVDSHGEEKGNSLFRNYGQAFPVSYQESLDARAAVPDILAIESIRDGGSDTLAMNLHRRLEDSAEVVRFKLIRAGQRVNLSDALPILENMGLRVLSEEPHWIKSRDDRKYSIHDFGMRATRGETIDVENVRTAFQDTFQQIWSGRAENDGFNRLVVLAELTTRQVTIIRAYCKYILQLGSTFSQSYIEGTFASNISVARDLVALFATRFDPAFESNRDEGSSEIEARILAELEQVTSLDEDRILRRYLGLIKATIRTNAYQVDSSTGELKDYVSLKFNPQQVPGMPLPKPAFEVFVYAPFVEGVHLRGGKVARGGLRWSDRREDFRTEILGLMKAQMVKNSVIVPVGAKGGFYVKQPPAGGDRQAFLEEGIRCYRIFLSGLLDITDNRVAGGIVPPENVVRYDEDDPYLVVAADKGTATFSDYANEVSRSYGFWLDDAYASGGSAGYDHKGMGITARGAWESVKRHFRELDMDPATDEFTAVGIGDMSGDVFGNGMLLSDKIKLVAAFDHRHVMLDPDPDPAATFAERKRMFDLPRSSWDLYDRSIISEGGGIYPRSAKSIPLSPQIRKVLDVEAEEMAPLDLLNAILKAPVDLWWNGGIGTYVKASSESHADAQDRGNDGLRINGNEMRCRVVGEGGNLGLTQHGRIEAAANGIRVNTDSIDNSAGVDCSDHEVNIKILLGEVVADGDMTMKQRDELLAEMTEEVGILCLRDNILQNIALSITESRGTEVLDAQIRLMRKLEREDRLDREIEMLPNDEELAERRAEGRGLTRPELAVVLAYAKTTLYADLLATELPDRAYFLRDLTKYFPRPLRRRFAEQIANHRLRREIVATWIANSIVNRGLDVFVSELQDDTGADLVEIAIAFVITRDAFGLLPLWGQIEQLGKEIPASNQIAMLNEAQEILEKGTSWFVAHAQRPLRIERTVAAFKPTIATIMDGLDTLLSSKQKTALDERRQSLEEIGVESELATAVASLHYLLSACDIVTVTRNLNTGGEITSANLMELARIYFALDTALDMTWLRKQLAKAPISSRWDRMALGGLEEQIAQIVRNLTSAAVKVGIEASDIQSANSAVESWLSSEVDGLPRYRALVRELAETEQPDLAMLTVAIDVAARLTARPVAQGAPSHQIAAE